MTTIRTVVGETVRFSKTVGESDVYLFSGITGDFSANHINEEFMRASSFGGRIAQGALLVGYMSTCSALLTERSHVEGADSTPVSLGYDRVRFIAPVFIGDTITAIYSVTEIQPERLRSRATIEVTNQRGETVAAAEHILKWVPRGQKAPSPSTSQLEE